jgi:hypothetical protein
LSTLRLANKYLIFTISACSLLIFNIQAYQIHLRNAIQPAAVEKTEEVREATGQVEVCKGEEK